MTTATKNTGNSPATIVGGISPLGLVRFVVGLRRVVKNWPQVAGRLVAASFRLGRSDITTVMRDGAVVTSPPSRPSWWPTFEIFAEDVYRLAGLGDVELSPGEVVLDLGAHIGAAAIAMARRWPAASLVCVEPNPSAFSYLERNLARNKVTASARNEAVGARDGRAVLTGADDASCEASTSYDAKGSSLEVPVVGFGRLLEEAGGPVKVLKLDCEGAEHDVLAVATKEVLSDVEVVLIEYHKTPDPRSTWPAVKGRLAELGFETTWHEAFSFRPGLGMAGLRRAA